MSGRSFDTVAAGSIVLIFGPAAGKTADNEKSDNGFFPQWSPCDLLQSIHTLMPNCARDCAATMFDPPQNNTILPLNMLCRHAQASVHSAMRCSGRGETALHFSCFPATEPLF
jgi:hypothetical protein